MSALAGRGMSSAKAAATIRHPGVGTWRRTLDVVGARRMGLALLAPLLAPSLWPSKSPSPGPVLFRQARLTGGRRGSRSGSGRCGSPRADPRSPRPVTRGSHGRRLPEADEPGQYPRLVNVLRGDMIVGPRDPALAARYPRECQWVLERKPGSGRRRCGCGTSTTSVDVVDAERCYLEHLVPQRNALPIWITHRRGDPSCPDRHGTT